MAALRESAVQEIAFPPFRLDPGNERLERDGQKVALRPKALAVLAYLAMRPQRLVGKRELLDALWPETFVSDTVVKVCIREIREALGDDPRAPRYLETVSHRGYRFIGVPLPGAAKETDAGGPPPDAGRALLAAGRGVVMVGRGRELRLLETKLDKARRGERQLVFITGEPGIGKTTLVGTFLERLGRHGMPVSSGQCLEFFGSGEAYMPVLEMLNRLCRGPRGSEVVGILRGRAPSWLVQMPWLVSEAEQEELRRRTLGLGAARMLREMVETLEVLASEAPLVLVFEDLHWSDASTLDLLSALARRPEPARLMILATLRPTELEAEHPLAGLLQDLRLHGLAEELVLELLTLPEVEEYLRVALGRTLPGLAELIELRTEGHPLFVVHLTEHLVSLLESNREQPLTHLLESGEFVVPDNLRQLIEGLIRRLLPQEQRLLEAASVAGARFSAAAVAGALGAETAEIESVADELARRGQAVRRVRTAQWPDGTLAGLYEFVHTLYRSVLYLRLPETARIRFHQRIGERLEKGFAAKASEIAGELAMHFERGHLPARAVGYREQAARTAIHRNAYREAIAHLTMALELVRASPPEPEGRQRELALRTALGPALMMTRGFASPEMIENYSRAQEICSGLEDTPEIFGVMWGRWMYHWIRAEQDTALGIGERFLTLAESNGQDSWRLLGHRMLGATLFNAGELAAAGDHLERGLALFDPQRTDDRHMLRFMSDSAVFCRSFRAHVLWLQGFPDQARASCREACERSRALGHPFSLALACGLASTIYILCGEREAALELIRTTREVSEAHGFPFFTAAAEIRQGFVMVEGGDVDAGFLLLEQGMERWEVNGAEQWRPLNRLFMAEAALVAGRLERGLAAVGEALEIVTRTGEKWCLPELLRLEAELLFRQDPHHAGVEPRLLESLETAREEGAVAWEIRSASSLARLFRDGPRADEGRALLARTLARAAEGFDTADLRRARDLLGHLEATSRRG